MSEAALAAFRTEREKASAAQYAQALRNMQKAHDECHDLADAPPAARLEARMQLEKARQTTASARSAVLAQAWAAGCFNGAGSLADAVRDRLAPLDATAPQLRAFPPSTENTYAL